jgi:hypothetical protein
MAKYMSQIPPEPKPKPRKIKPQPAKGPRKPRGKMPEREMPKRISDPKDLMPKIPKIPKPSAAPLGRKAPAKRIPKAMVPKPAKGTKGSFDDALRTQNNQREILGSTKAQRAASALEMMNDMRSRNLLRSRNLSRKPNKKGI